MESPATISDTPRTTPVDIDHLAWNADQPRDELGRFASKLKGIAEKYGNGTMSVTSVRGLGAKGGRVKGGQGRMKAAHELVNKGHAEWVGGVTKDVESKAGHTVVSLTRTFRLKPTKLDESGKPSTTVTNRRTVLAIETLTANLGAVRREQVNGRDYLVAPLTMIVPGVLPGSKGPLYYPPEEVSRNPDGWNGMPIVVNHPVVEGRNVSARSPRILERYGIGHVYAANIGPNGNLVGEGWFDVGATKRIEPRIYDDLIAKRPIELSTGLFTRNEPVRNGKCPRSGMPYDHVAKDYRPDHLAILPDTKGACSVRDGCGVLVNGREYGYTDADIDHLAHNKLPDMSPGKACKILHDRSVKGHKLTRQQQKMFGALCSESPTGNDDMDIDHLATNAQARDKIGRFSAGDAVTVHMPGYPMHGMEGHVIKADDQVTKVKLKGGEAHNNYGGSDDKSVHGFHPSNLKAKHTKPTSTVTNERTMTRDQTIAHLTTNCDCYKGKQDALKLLPDDVLANMKANADRAEEYNELVANGATTGRGTKTMSPADWYDAAPDEIKEIIRNAKAVQDEEKVKLVDKIVTANAKTKEGQDAIRPTFEAMSLPTLKTLADNLPEPTANDNPFLNRNRKVAYAPPAGGVRRGKVQQEEDVELVDNSVYPVPIHS